MVTFFFFFFSDSGSRRSDNCKPEKRKKMDNNDISDDLTEDKVKEILNNLKDPQKQPKVSIYMFILIDQNCY